MAAFDALGDEVVDDDDDGDNAESAAQGQQPREGIEEIAQRALDLCAELERAAMGAEAQRQHAVQTLTAAIEAKRLTALQAAVKQAKGACIHCDY